MYLIFPDSMIIPEVTSRREDNHFEDWLTATLIENTNQEQKDDPESKLPGITDLWMLEIAERNGKTWMGTFQVKFETGVQELEVDHIKSDQETGVLSFSINTDTGEMRFD
jgi:ssRNA-specific RNase YbeY (16S rRNA maturation enzyme)